MLALLASVALFAAPIEIDGPITNESVSSWIEQLTALKGPVTIKINSPGGSVLAAFDLQKAIEAHGDVTCVVDGWAASAAFSIFESCQTRIMTKRSVLMAHEPSLKVEGQEHDFKNALATLRVFTRAMVEHLAAHMKVSAACILAHISEGKEWWMSYEEALAVGAVDKVGP